MRCVRCGEWFGHNGVVWYSEYARRVAGEAVTVMGCFKLLSVSISLVSTSVRLWSAWCAASMSVCEWRERLEGGTQIGVFVVSVSAYMSVVCGVCENGRSA